MSKKTGQYPIPFDGDGNLLSYPYGTEEWRDNYVFEDTLTYVTYYRGRSSVTIGFKDSNGCSYEMFISDFDELITSKGLFGKSVRGKWTFVKKGQNYGIKAVFE